MVAAIEEVGTTAAHQPVVTDAALKEVITATTYQRVAALLALKPVAPIAAGFRHHQAAERQLEIAALAVSHQPVVAGAAVHRVHPRPGNDSVVAGTCQEQFIHGRAEQAVVPVLPDQQASIDARHERIVATAAFEPVEAGAAAQGVIAVTTQERVAAPGIAQQVVAGAAVDRVVVDPAIEGVIAVVALKDVSP